jgi:predicted transcriptional regulator
MTGKNVNPKTLKTLKTLIDTLELSQKEFSKLANISE